MALSNMIAEMRGAVPQYSALLARTHIQEAWTDIRKRGGWSFQLAQDSFATPSVINIGTATPTFGSTTVTLDSIATAAVSVGSQYGSLITQRQFRFGATSIYDIVGYDGASTLTLDRPWLDATPQPPGGPYAGGYSIYQCYFTAPVQNFNSWEMFYNTTVPNWLDVDATKYSRDRINRGDPQRATFSYPIAVVPLGIDTRPNTSTPNYMRYELYPGAASAYSFTRWYLWLGPDLTLPSDTLPYPMDEATVKTFARVKAYEWAEANRDPQTPRGQGANYQFLISEANEKGEFALKQIRLLDRDRVDVYYSQLTRVKGLAPLATFNPANGTVSARNL